MSDVGIQPRGHTPRGLYQVKILRPIKVISRHCQPGDVIIVEQSGRKIMPADDGLTEEYAEYLIQRGIAKRHVPQPGDKPFSVAPQRPKVPDEPKIEAAVMTQQRSAEKAITGRQKAAI